MELLKHLCKIIPEVILIRVYNEEPSRPIYETPGAKVLIKFVVRLLSRIM
jgi:hypothetical protein